MTSETYKNNTLWTWSELATALKIDNLDSGPGVCRVIIDSRHAREGDLFIALSGNPGSKFSPSRVTDRDGHDFIKDAQKKGASGCVAQSNGLSDLPTLKVEDTYEAMWNLAAAARKRIKEPVIGVTGSSGKTTFKDFLVEASGGYGSPLSFNNHIGVPLSLLNSPFDDKPCFTFEIGTNNPGEIGPLTRLVCPDIAVLLNVHNAHIGNFGSHKDLAKEKLDIFKAAGANSSLVCEEGLEQNVSRKCYTFGYGSGCDAQIIEVTKDSMTLKLFKEKLAAKIPGGGKHRSLTLGAVILVQKLLGQDISKALSLTADSIPSGRGNEIETSQIRIIDESYNANPTSMISALETFQKDSLSGRRVLVLGEMLELGPAAKLEHRNIANTFENFDKVFTIGEGFKNISDTDWRPEADEKFLEELKRMLLPGDSVLVKGSNKVFWAKNFVGRLISLLS